MILHLHPHDWIFLVVFVAILCDDDGILSARLAGLGALRVTYL